MGYNYADKIKELHNEHSLDDEGDSLTIANLFHNGVRIQRRWYGKDGLPVRNRDYTNHGNPKQHKIVPHDHRWDWSKTPPRQKEEIPNKHW